jgi:Bacterial regulatory proteins, lacI family
MHLHHVPRLNMQHQKNGAYALIQIATCGAMIAAWTPLCQDMFGFNRETFMNLCEFRSSSVEAPFPGSDLRAKARSRPTIKDVAKSARVSVATVSRVINGLGIVSRETSLRVRIAIEELQYTPDQIAVQLSRNGGIRKNRLKRYNHLSSLQNSTPSRPHSTLRNARLLVGLKSENEELKRLAKRLVKQTMKCKELAERICIAATKNDDPPRDGATKEKFQRLRL